jgi:putative MATE family efflux protein
MKIQLSDHFTYRRLLRFTLPSIAMMIFTSIYGVVDGLFVSNFVGKTSFAAVNFIMPVLMILGALGFMFGTGGSALIAKTMGEGDSAKANRIFSLIVYVTIGCGVILTLIGIPLMRPVASLLGAEGQMLEDCVLYGQAVLIALPFYMIQFAFQSFFIAAERPGMGFVMSLVSGGLNMALDALFVAGFGWELVGAALATAISQAVGGVLAIVYFCLPRRCILRLGKAELDGRAFLRTCTNGSSELLANISMSVVGILYNYQLMQYEGEDGVAAYGVLMYVNMIFLAVFIGYAVGMAPVVSYHYGAANHGELQSLRRKSLMIISISSVAMLILGIALAKPLAWIFVSYDPALVEMTVRAFCIYSFSFLFAGPAIFGSSFFTALNNGLVSAIISFLRTMVFQVAAVLLLPLVWGLDGIWISIVVGEALAMLVMVGFMVGMRKRYHY